MRKLLVLALSLLASQSQAELRDVVQVDSQGIPVRCVSPLASAANLEPLSPLSAAALPAGTRGWECIPGVIRGDGVETFRLEVDVNGAATAVRLTGLPVYLIGPAPAPIALHDDGLAPDLVAGDGVWSAGPFRYYTGIAFPAFYANDATSPAGLYTVSLGTLQIDEAGGATTEFLLAPSVGLLRSDIPATPVVISGADVAVSRHLVNLKSSTRTTQSSMRFLGGDMAVLTRRLYQVLPDVFDFLFFFSNDKIERAPRTESNNFIAGLHGHVQTNYTGTGLTPYNDSGYYGSANRLLSINLLDAYQRGIVGNNITHEMQHQWASYTQTPLNDGSSHYHYLSSVGSLLGGFAWIDHGDGTFGRNCDEGRNGAHHADPLDLYLMGLIADSSVPGQRISPAPSGALCDQVITSSTTTTVADIAAIHGPRTPGPATAKRDFSMAFVIESNGRLLNATERTFYDKLAEHYTSTLPAQAPDPYVGFNWPPITRFFGQGTTWTSDIVQLTTAVIPEAAPPSRLQLSPPMPNPSRGSALMTWVIPSKGGTTHGRVEVIDSQGRLVATLMDGLVSPGPQSVSWDGLDARGRPTAAGVYWIRASVAEQVVSRKLVRVP